jgi:hypothetical protein
MSNRLPKRVRRELGRLKGEVAANEFASFRGAIFAEDDRRIVSAVERSRAADMRCLEALAEMAPGDARLARDDGR